MEEPDPVIIGPSAEEIAEAVNFFSQGKNPVEKKTIKIAKPQNIASQICFFSQLMCSVTHRKSEMK